MGGSAILILVKHGYYEIIIVNFVLGEKHAADYGTCIQGGVSSHAQPWEDRQGSPKMLLVLFLINYKEEFKAMPNPR